MTEDFRLEAVTNSNAGYKRIKKLYLEAFPADERAPMFLIKRRAAQHKADSWNMYDGSEWVGWTYIITHDSMAYIFYLAIDDAKRGQGYGTAALQAIRQKYANYRIFLSLEALDKDADNYRQRLKRHAFYEKNGLKDLPHKIREASVVYSVMGFDDEIKPEEYKAILETYTGKFFGMFLKTEMID